MAQTFLPGKVLRSVKSVATKKCAAETMYVKLHVDTEF